MDTRCRVVVGATLGQVSPALAAAPALRLAVWVLVVVLEESNA